MAERPPMRPFSRRAWLLAAGALFITELLIATVWAKVPFVRAIGASGRQMRPVTACSARPGSR